MVKETEKRIIKQKCPYCPKVIQSTSRNEVNHNLAVHMGACIERSKVMYKKKVNALKEKSN